jgi:putative endonuclease
MSNISVGQKGEDIAEKYLKRRGYKILDRNFRSRRWGEIDIVATKDDVLVFVEVKARVGTEYGEPVEAITPFKIGALKRAGQYYKLENPETPDALRIDVVSVILDPETHEPREIKLYEDAR